MLFWLSVRGRTLNVYSQGPDGAEQGLLAARRGEKRRKRHDLGSEWSGEYLRYITQPWFQDNLGVFRPEFQASRVDGKGLQLSYSLDNKSTLRLKDCNGSNLVWLVSPNVELYEDAGNQFFLDLLVPFCMCFLKLQRVEFSRPPYKSWVSRIWNNNNYKQRSKLQLKKKIKWLFAQLLLQWFNCERSCLLTCRKELTCRDSFSHFSLQLSEA